MHPTVGMKPREANKSNEDIAQYLLRFLSTHQHVAITYEHAGSIFCLHPAYKQYTYRPTVCDTNVNLTLRDIVSVYDNWRKVTNGVTRFYMTSPLTMSLDDVIYCDYTDH